MTTILRFLKAFFKWALIGFAKREPMNVRYIYGAICTPCPHFKVTECGLCGCFISKEYITLNKLVWLSESCPADPPRWVGSGWIARLNHWLHFH